MIDSRRLSYDDIDLIPKKGILRTRKDADTSVMFGEMKFKVPICPANMACSINFDLAKQLSDNGYFYILHRFCNYQNIKDWLVENKNLRCLSISIGVQKEDFDLIEWLNHDFCGKLHYLTIDIAHGNSIRMKDMLEFINTEFLEENRPFVIAGNVAEHEAVLNLKKWGADSAKVGISNGRSCSTRNHTGFGVSMVNSLRDCYEGTFPIMADGGIQVNGDIVKSLVLGSSMSMAGAHFAACSDSPAETIEDYVQISNLWEKNVLHGYQPLLKKKKFKKFFGSASIFNGNDKNIEGELIYLPCNEMTYLEKLDEIQQDIASAISYAGEIDVKSLRNVRWIVNR